MGSALRSICYRVLHRSVEPAGLTGNWPNRLPPVSLALVDLTAGLYGEARLSFHFRQPDRQHRNPLPAVIAESSPGNFSIVTLFRNGDMYRSEHARHALRGSRVRAVQRGGKGH
jgi:hypothetical protein